MLKKLLTLLLFSSFKFAQSAEFPFDYDLHLFSLEGRSGRVMVCLHGYGDNHKVAQTLRDSNCIEATLVSFNFPEYDIKQGRPYDPQKATFGTIDELLPALYVIKKTIFDRNLDSIDLYGFSAGGGALINVIGVLNSSKHDDALKKIGIGKSEKKRCLSAIQKGLVILDTPLKSVEEIIDLRGSTEELEILAKNYRNNGFRPIDSLKLLKGLSLDILLHFQENDEVIFNRDDQLYIERLEETQVRGNVTVIIGNDGGHMIPHQSLWNYYLQKIKN
jgi:hypothetical protein